MVGSIHRTFGMVRVVLEAGVDDGVVRRDERVLVATVQVHPIRVEEEPKLHEEEVHVDGDQQGDPQQWGRTDKLINRFICYDRPRGGVVEDMVVAVVLPKPEVNVSKPVVEELEEVGEDPRKSQNSNMIRQRSVSPATERVANSILP